MLASVTWTNHVSSLNLRSLSWNVVIFCSVSQGFSEEQSGETVHSEASTVRVLIAFPGDKPREGNLKLLVALPSLGKLLLFLRFSFLICKM